MRKVFGYINGPGPFWNRRPDLFLLLAGAAAPCLVAVLLYLNSLGNPLLWDDQLYIASDHFVRDGRNLLLLLNPKNFWYVLPVPNSSRPVWLASVIMDISSSGGALEQMRMTSLLINGFNASLLYCAALLLGAGPLAALTAALLFAAHPIHTEAVNIISFRSHALALFFMLAALICRLLARQSANGRFSIAILNAAALVCAFLACLSHEIAVTTLPLFLAYEFLPAGLPPDAAQEQPRSVPVPGSYRGLWLSLLAALLLFFAFYRMPRSGYDFGQTKDSLKPVASALNVRSLMPAAAQPKQIAEAPKQHISPPGAPPWNEVYVSRKANLLTMSRIFGEYLYKLAVPYPLQADYNPRVSRSWSDKGPWLAWLAWLALAALCWRFRRSSPLIPPGFLWLAITMLPLTNVIRMYNIQAERYIYVASAGFCMLAGGFAEATFARLKKPWVTLAAVLLPILLAFGSITVLRNRDYKDAKSFFGSIIRTDPNVPRALINLAYYHLSAKEPRQAEESLIRAIEAYPEGAEARNSLAEFYLNSGKHEDALESIKPLLAPGGKASVKTYYMQAAALAKSGRIREAVLQLDAALNTWPDNEPLMSALALYSSKAGMDGILLNRLANIDLSRAPDSLKCNAALAYGRAGRSRDSAAALGFLPPEKQRQCKNRARQSRVEF